MSYLTCERRRHAPSSSAFTRTRASGVSTSTRAAVSVERHFGHRLGIAPDQMPRADVAVERHQLGEKAPRPDHRIAALAVDGRHHHQRAALGIEGGDQLVDQRRADLRHVAEADDRAVDVRPAPPQGRPSPRSTAPRRNSDCARAARRGLRAPLRPCRADGRSPRSPGGRARPAPARRRCARAAGRRSRPGACSARPCGSSARRRG